MAKSNSHMKKSKSVDSLTKKKRSNSQIKLSPLMASKKKLHRSPSSSSPSMGVPSEHLVKSFGSKSAPHVSHTRSKITSRSHLEKSIKSVQSLGIQRRTSSITSLASQYNMVTGRYTASVKLSEALSQNTGHINQYGQSLYDCALIYLVCPFHKKVALSKIFNKGLFLPFGPIKTGESWLNAVVGLIQKILSIKPTNEKLLFSDPSVIDILRIQVPTYFEFITRVSYYAKLTSDACHANYCNDNSMIAWFAITDVNSKVFSSEYLGPEPAIFYSPSNMICREITIVDVLLFCIQGNKTPEGELLNSVSYKENDVLKFYSDYLQHCYPSEFMTLHSFKTYITKWELPIGANDMAHVFKSFAFNENKYINFYELLLGLAMVDKTINKDDSGASLSEFRTNYVFRYYAKHNANYLTDSGWQKFVSDLRRSESDLSISKMQKKFSPNGKVTKQALNHMLNSLVNSPGSKCNMPDIFHCSESPLMHLRTKQSYPSIHLRQITPSEQKNAIQAKLQRARELCANCRSKQYTLSMHMVKMSNEGHIYEPVLNKQADIDRMSQHKRILSERYFTKSFVCNQMVDLIRAFATKIKINKSKINVQSQDWENTTVRDHCVDKIIKICLEAKNLFQNCSRVIKVTSPCYVIGDLHGNLHDLLVYEKAIWKLGPYFNPANYLFLGDYVDRGDYSVECIIYLLCTKLLVPDRIFMLRGNHECRALQKEFTFYTECKQKFGNKGEEVWEAFNDVFDVMPLCAVIDESIFCAHGGIPSCAQKIEQIMAVKSPLKDPENDSDIALEILWNDPVTNQEYVDLIKNSPSIVNNASTNNVNNVSNNQNGFLPNTKRGTACYYSEDALNYFLNANSLSHVIRAHEVIPAGYQYHMGGRCITVFSCSHYCGGINEAAVAFVHDSKIRVMKVDTKG